MRAYNRNRTGAESRSEIEHAEAARRAKLSGQYMGMADYAARHLGVCER